MQEPFTLHVSDWLIIGLYMALALAVGCAMKRRAGSDRISYFLADRSLPWWRVNATGEIVAMLSGMALGTLLALFTDLPYEVRLLWIAAASAVGLLAGVVYGPPTDHERLQRFIDRVAPIGWWPHSPHHSTVSWRLLTMAARRWAALVVGTLLLLVAGHQFLLVGRWLLSGITGLIALGCFYVGITEQESRHRVKMEC